MKGDGELGDGEKGDGDKEDTGDSDTGDGEKGVNVLPGVISFGHVHNVTL